VNSVIFRYLSVGFVPSVTAGGVPVQGGDARSLFSGRAWWHGYCIRSSLNRDDGESLHIPMRRDNPKEKRAMEPIVIDSKNWLAFPIGPLTPSAPDQQKWVAVLTGIAVFELHSATPAWTHEELSLTVDDMLQAVFTMADRSPSAGHHLLFVVENSTSFAAINSIAAISGSDPRELGLAIDAVEPSLIGHTIRCFAGLTIKVAVASEHAQVLRVGFQSTLTGWIREFRTKGA
jgi:hypothetical protein